MFNENPFDSMPSKKEQEKAKRKLELDFLKQAMDYVLKGNQTPEEYIANIKLQSFLGHFPSDFDILQGSETIFQSLVKEKNHLLKKYSNKRMPSSVADFLIDIHYCKQYLQEVISLLLTLKNKKGRNSVPYKVVEPEIVEVPESTKKNIWNEIDKLINIQHKGNRYRNDFPNDDYRDDFPS